MTRKTLIIGGASGIGFAVGTLLAGRGEEIMLAGRDSAKLDAARQRLGAHAASVSTLVLDISREEELVALSETLGEVNNIVVTAGSQAPGGLLSGLDLRAARQAFDTKFWGSLNVARYLSGNIAPRGTLTFTSGFVARRTVAGAIVKTTMNAAIEADKGAGERAFPAARQRRESGADRHGSVCGDGRRRAGKNARRRGGNPASQNLGKGAGHRTRVSFRHGQSVCHGVGH